MNKYKYTILDQEAFDEYMKRKHPKTIEAMLFAINNKITFHFSAEQKGVHYQNLINHSANLQRMGILKKEYLPTPKDPTERTKIELRKEIRKKIMTADLETLVRISILFSRMMIR